jgi:type II restriction/modification system DNA methylase subunit YeeA
LKTENITPERFIEIWHKNSLNERAGAQAYFSHLCRLLGVDEPLQPGVYQYEPSGKKSSGSIGYADVWKDGFFGWENKKPGRNLDDALIQLKNYAQSLNNPPLLVVCDRETIRIHKNFNGYPDEPDTIEINKIGLPENIQKLKWVFTDPDKLKPRKSSTAITEDAAGKFADIAKAMRERSEDPFKVAHFLSQCIFCMFAEDEGILPKDIFSNLLLNSISDPARAANRLADLFKKMRKGGDYGDYQIDYFNSELFNKVDVPELNSNELVYLAKVAKDMDWRFIEPTILGTLFERGLNPDKRSQLGAHYTDEETINKIIKPVVVKPLEDEWRLVLPKIEEILSKSKTEKDKYYKEAYVLFNTFLERLRNFVVFDPACGSGNFLYVALKLLKGFEKTIKLEAEDVGIQRTMTIEICPDNIKGIELEPYAAELARVTVWIGELQWMLKNGYSYSKNPILKPLKSIENKDALFDINTGKETQWPKCDVIIGNPPFLGDKKMISELGEKYTVKLRRLFKGRVAGGADLVTYWFEKARAHIEQGQCQLVGLVSTNSIRGGKNQKVLSRICETTKIFNAWSDEAWINEGAAVRVSLVCFGNSNQKPRLNGQPVHTIFADLTAQTSADSSIIDLTTAKPLAENKDIAFQGTIKVGDFDISGALAREWLKQPNPNGKPNSDVVRPWANGMDITRRSSDTWIIDFGTNMTEDDASLYEIPFAHIHTHVKPVRELVRREGHKKYWWRHAESRSGMRKAMQGLTRYIITSRVSKHRMFVFMDSHVLPDSATIAITTDSDITFGILESRFHKLWALALGTALEDRPRYTPSTTFETFPFPEGLTPTDTKARIPDTPTANAIAQATQKLNELRNNWLNPAEWVDWIRTPEEEKVGFPLRAIPKPEHETELKKRTLTNLYNAMPTWLSNAHYAIDKAVATAYGWTDYTPDMSDSEILSRLLCLNVKRHENELLTPSLAPLET